MKILMVCLGNICRSPLAQGILENKMPSWQVDSAGTASYHIGNAPDPRSIAIANRHGIDISGQKARQLIAEDLDRFDLILTMDAQNYNNALGLTNSRNQRDKIHLILNFLQPAMNRQVPDPYYDDKFDLVFELLDEATDSIIRKYS